MDVNLMADVPDKFIFGCIENVVERNRQLDHAKIRPQMSPVFRQPTNQLPADFFSQPL